MLCPSTRRTKARPTAHASNLRGDSLMAIAISANDEHHPGGALSPPDIKAQHVEGGGPSSVQMGQENVIALLLQQQEEVLREIRDQKKVRHTHESGMVETAAV